MLFLSHQLDGVFNGPFEKRKVGRAKPWDSGSQKGGPRWVLQWPWDPRGPKETWATWPFQGGLLYWKEGWIFWTHTLTAVKVVWVHFDLILKEQLTIATQRTCPELICSSLYTLNFFSSGPFNSTPLLRTSVCLHLGFSIQERVELFPHSNLGTISWLSLCLPSQVLSSEIGCRVKLSPRSVSYSTLTPHSLYPTPICPNWKKRALP